MAAKSKTVRLVARISGTRDGEDWPAPGETIALPEAEANQLLLNGMAVTPDVETATANGAVETATTRGNQPLRQTAAQAKADADAQAAAKAKADADAQAAAAKLLEEQAKQTAADADAEKKDAAKK
jgi:membrane protein involved in colicin uptake